MIVGRSGRDPWEQNLAGNYRREVTDITFYFTRYYSPKTVTKVAHPHRFLLDFHMSRIDNHIVETMLNLIYPPSDTPKGLRPGITHVGSG